MTDDRLQAALPDGEALRYVADCRTDGAVGFTDERLLVVDEAVTSVEFTAIAEVAARDVDWFVAILSVAIVGVGLLSGADRPLVGIALVAAGIVSLVVVYRKRGKVTVSVENRGKPVSFYLDSTDEFIDRLEQQLDRYEQRLDDREESD